MSYPNQKTVLIHQSEQVPFLKVGIEEWQEAIKNLRYVKDTEILKEPKLEPKSSSIALYLYLASNADKFNLEMSQKAFENSTGFSKSSYHRAINELSTLHYIYKGADGRLNFATTPHEDIFQNWEKDDSNQRKQGFKSDFNESQIGDKRDSDLNREINNIDKIKNNKEINTATNSSSPTNFIRRDIWDDFYSNPEEAEQHRKWYNSDEQKRIRNQRQFRQNECARIESENEFGFEDY